MMKTHCCNEMSEMVTYTCDRHPDRFDCPDCLINYSPMFDEYGIIIHDGGTAVSSINFCPCCGSRLPDSKRDLWFEELAALGFDDPFEEEIPEQYLTDAWYSGR